MIGRLLIAVPKTRTALACQCLSLPQGWRQVYHPRSAPSSSSSVYSAVSIDNQVALQRKRPAVRINQIATHLKHLRLIGVHTSTLQKSLAARIFQCAFRNFDHRVCFPRFGAGSMPFAFSTLAVVPRPTSWFRLANAP
jgi:hypothetical protein